jgi:hypothetical protein
VDYRKGKVTEAVRAFRKEYLKQIRSMIDHHCKLRHKSVFSCHNMSQNSVDGKAIRYGHLVPPDGFDHEPESD